MHDCEYADTCVNRRSILLSRVTARCVYDTMRRNVFVEKRLDSGPTSQYSDLFVLKLTLIFWVVIFSYFTSFSAFELFALFAFAPKTYYFREHLGDIAETVRIFFFQYYFSEILTRVFDSCVRLDQNALQLPVPPTVRDRRPIRKSATFG